MQWMLNLVSEGFIWSIGITRPKPGKERIAALYITGILVVTLLGMVGAFFFLLNRI